MSRADRLCVLAVMLAALMFAGGSVGGRTNLCHNAVDRHLAARGGQPALIYISTETGQSRTYTYAEVHEVREAGRRFRPLGWLFTVFPRAFRRHAAAFWVSLAVTVAGCAFGAAAAEHDHALAAQALGPARRVHGRVSAAHDHGAPAHAHGSVAGRELVRAHQVDAGQEFVGRVDADEVLAIDVHEHRQTCACPQEHGIEL